MKFPGDMPANEFLTTHWQKSPLFMPGAIDALSPSLEAEELAWLATLDDVESRLIFSDRSGGSVRYRVENGPFEKSHLANLPERDWTLLVQDVDKHLPDFASLFALVGFIPDWRIDDLMISFAAPGGGVGPHKDNYDVFLCQGDGSREWMLADPDATTKSDSSESLLLLEPFENRSPLIATCGDVLYLPPGIPHWGIALDACMTYSIGMRAPELNEFRLGFEREFPDKENPFLQETANERIFYRDPDLGLGESVPGQISARSIERCRSLVAGSASVSDKELATTLGCVATDPKAWLAPDAPSSDEIRAFLRVLDPLQAVPVHGMARIAWWADHAEIVVFANGSRFSTDLRSLELIRALCRTRRLEGTMLQKHIKDDLVKMLLTMGVFDLFSGKSAG